jgi:two-component system sensor histidine kinase PilS (NtrC family)
VDPAVRPHAPGELAELPRKLLAITAIRVAVVTLTLGALFALAQVQPPREQADVGGWEYALIAATYGASLLHVLGLRHGAAVLPLAHAQPVIDALIVSVLVVMTGGIESLFTFAYVFVVLGASITLYRRGALVATLAVFLTFGTVVLLQVDRALPVMPRVEAGKAVLSFALQIVGASMAGLLSSALSEKARSTGRRLIAQESELRRLEEVHAAILRSLPAGILTVDRDGRVSFANDAALGILRLARSAVEGATLEALVPAVAAAMTPQAGASGLPERVRFEEAHRPPEGGEIRLGFSFAPLSAGAGHEASTLVVFQDVTDLVRLKDAVARSERLATVGRFAAGLAHEVRNPLAAICASIDVLGGALELPDGMRRLMDNVVREAERLDKLVGDFLALARPPALSLRPMELGPLVGGVLEVFRPDAAGRGIAVEARLEAGVWAPLDGDLVRQVLWNLLRNAAEALEPRGGVVAVSARVEGDLAVLEVRDDGPGMPPEVLERVFEPFFTTRARGSGLGLAITHAIAEAHGGKVSLESRPGAGTVVTLRFPRVARAPEGAGAPGVAEPRALLGAQPSTLPAPVAVDA